MSVSAFKKGKRILFVKWSGCHGKFTEMNKTGNTKQNQITTCTNSMILDWRHCVCCTILSVIYILLFVFPVRNDMDAGGFVNEFYDKWWTMLTHLSDCINTYSRTFPAEEYLTKYLTEIVLVVIQISSSKLPAVNRQ